MTDKKEGKLAVAESVFLDKVDKKVTDFFKDNADIGSENLSGALPQLKITEANSQNEGVDGQYTKAGTFYYAPTKESFDEIDVSIMTISRGFYALDNQKKPKPKFTQLVGGIILENRQPFIMFISGTRLQGMWDFGKKIKPFTKRKDSPVPMMAFKVNLKLKKVTTDYGTNHVVDFNLTRDGDKIEVIQDIDLLKVIKLGVAQIEDTFKGFISQKEVDRYTGEPVGSEPEEAGVEVSPDDISF